MFDVLIVVFFKYFVGWWAWLAPRTSIMQDMYMCVPGWSLFVERQTLKSTGVGLAGLASVSCHQPRPEHYGGRVAGKMPSCIFEYMFLRS